MKRLLLPLSLLLNLGFIIVAFVIWSFAGEFIDRMIGSNRERLATQYELLNDSAAPVVFLGDSITQGGWWNELFPGSGALNRGIGGDTTQDVLDRIQAVYDLKPGKLFVMIGINDLNRGLGSSVAISNYKKLFDGIDANLPDTRVYLQSVLPVNDDWAATDNSEVPALNASLQEHAAMRGYTYIDLHTAFSGANGQLQAELSNDGIHLLGAGYALWQSELVNYVNE